MFSIYFACVFSMYSGTWLLLWFRNGILRFSVPTETTPNGALLSQSSLSLPMGGWRGGLEKQKVNRCCAKNNLLETAMRNNLLERGRKQRVTATILIEKCTRYVSDSYATAKISPGLAGSRTHSFCSGSGPERVTWK